MIVELILITIIVCSTFILLSNHPIYCLFSLILTFINFSILLLQLSLEFLALSYVIVYVGAICVLFIFVILLLNIRVYNLTSRENFWGLFTTMITALLLFLFFKLNLSWVTIDLNRLVLSQSDVLSFGKSFFNYNWEYLILTVLLLLLAVIATIAVSLKKGKNKQVNFSFFE